MEVGEVGEMEGVVEGWVTSTPATFTLPVVGLGSRGLKIPVKDSKFKV